MAGNSVQALESLRTFVTAADLSDDKVFQEVAYRVCVVFGIVPTASALRISRPTLERWTRGVTRPHEVMSEPLRRYALRRIEEELASTSWCVRLVRAEGTDDGRVPFSGTREACEAWAVEHALPWPDSFHRRLSVETYEEENNDDE